MKKVLTLFVFLFIFLSFIGCQSNSKVDSYINIEATETFLNKEKEVRIFPDIGDQDMFDFAYFRGAPKVKENHHVSDIIKFYATPWSYLDSEHAIVIDIENSEIYEEASIGIYGVRSVETIKKVDDIEVVIELLEKYDVLSWQNYYSNVKEYHSYEDGTSWRVVVQYNDGTIETFRGEGTGLTSIIPDNYKAFMDKLDAYVLEHVQK